MRVIAGSRKSLPLKTVAGMNTRPTTDRIKETLFNMIQNNIVGRPFLDLFAGSGGIGIEALSRGASAAVFVEQDRKAAICIRENLSFTKFTDSARLYTADVRSVLTDIREESVFGCIFMDPPYDKGLEREVLQILSGSGCMDEDTLIVVEASLNTDFSYLNELGYTIIKDKKYKTNRHLFLRRLEEK